MARLSKRNPNKDSAAQIDRDPINIELPRIATAAYARLSSEEEQTETVSTQVALLKEFIDDSDEFSLSEIYIDNGYSGTNFDRPDFTRMMSDVQAGRIHCIVVKDLSRFGRNFLETGYYIETLLPRLNVRLIAINDGFDSSRSEDMDSISVPVKNMVNELYAKDVSRKICASNEARRRAGNFTIGHSVYGYSVDRESNSYVVNPETAPVVQLIFHWIKNGVGASEVADRLNSLGIMTPADYKYKNEFNKDLSDNTDWNANRIMTLIKKEIYTGDRILGARQAALYKGQDEIWMPKSKWTVYEKDHAPLITKEDFEKVTDYYRQNSARIRTAHEHLKTINPDVAPLFPKRLICAKCGKTMDYRIGRSKDGIFRKESIDYVCKEKYYTKGKVSCDVRIREDQLIIAVIDSIRLMTKTVIDQAEILKKLCRYRDERNPVNKLKNRISTIERDADNWSEKISRLYEDLSEGMIDRDDYIKLRAKYQSERDSFRQKLVNAQSDLAAAEQGLREFEKIICEISALTQDITVSTELVDHFIDRIIVGENGRVEVRFKCEDVLQRIIYITGGDR